MASFMHALPPHPERKKKATATTVRVKRYIRSASGVKARAAKEAHAELSARAQACDDLSGMTRIHRGMTRAEAIAAVMGISVEAAALL